MTELHTRQDVYALLRRLVRRESWESLRKILARTRPADVAANMEHLTWAEQRKLYGAIEDRSYAAEVLANLSDELSRAIAKDLKVEEVVALLELMEPDDATDVVAVLPDDLRARVLQDLGDEDDATEVRSLLAWPPDSAGGLMSPQVFRMSYQASGGEAIEVLRREQDNIDAVYLYLVDEYGRLMGVTSLRTLLTHPPNMPVRIYMTPDVISVSPLDDQEEVARFVARYDLLAIPVIDSDRRLLGIVTVDDVVDVIRDEAAEDMLLMAGVNDDAADFASRSVAYQAWRRGGWLVATLLGGLVMSEVIRSYEASIEYVAILAGFLPVVMGMSGNVATQAGTIAVRGLATGHVQLGGAMRFVFTQARVGVVLGSLFAVLIGAYAVGRLFGVEPMIGASIGVSVLFAVSVGGVVGAIIPVLLERVGADPAIATGPFVTTFVDFTSVIVYFNIARLLL